MLAGTGAVMVLMAAAAFAFGDADDPLSGSDTIILGGTTEPTPDTAFAQAAENLYLHPLGFDDGATIDHATCSTRQIRNTIKLVIESKYFVGSGHQRCDLWSEVVARIDFVDWRAKLPMTSANDSTVRQPCHPSSPTQLIVEPTRWDIRGAGKPVWSSRIRGLQSGAGSSWLTPAWAQTIESAS